MKEIPHILTFLPTVFLLLGGPVESARILSISCISSKSHKIIYEPLLFKLGERGHSVTILGPIKIQPSTKNVQNLLTFNMTQVTSTIEAMDFFESRESSNLILNAISNPFLWLIPYMEAYCRATYEDPQIQEILRKLERGDPDGHYDLVIFPPLWNDCIYGLIYKLNTTSIVISQLPIMPWVSSSLGSPWLPSITPLIYYEVPGEMDFLQRIVNFLGLMYTMGIQHFHYRPKMEALYREYVGPDVPGIHEIQSNVSLVLANSHISFNPPQPLLQDVIEVGGMHLRPAKPLDKELDEFLTGAGEDGFILFSLGSYLPTSAMPQKYRDMFFNVFKRLNQRILWKWEIDPPPNVPHNIKLYPWIPQQDVLGHKNIRLFITHGGHGSTTEAIYEGVPLLGIAMFADQDSNMKRAQELGFAVTLKFQSLTEESLYESIQKILQEPQKYAKKAKELSAIYQDQIEHPLSRAVYWVEYVLRHKGATHLRSAGRHLNFFQYYSLDVIATLAAIFLFFSLINIYMLKAISRKLFTTKIQKRVKNETKSKKKQ